MNGLSAVGATTPLPRSCTARRSAPTPCSSGAGQGSGSSRPPGFATCWKCAAATGAGSGDLWGDFVPLVDRDMRLEVGERTLADGTIRRGVDAAEVRTAAKLLLEQGAQSLAVLFINAYANPENERRAVAEIRSVWPNEYVTASHEVLAEIREFERFSTTAINAYLQPVVAAYLGKLENVAARRRAFDGELHIVQSNGGVMSTASARRFPVRTALSGPAAGVIAATAHRASRRL